METEIIQIQKITLIVTILVLITSILTIIITTVVLRTDFLKTKIPIKFGFFINNEIVNKLEIVSGDPAKRIPFKIHNTSKTTITGVILDIRFLQPLALSGTDSALTEIQDHTMHGRSSDKSFYLINYSDFKILGDGQFNIFVELNTNNISPGTYIIEVRIDTIQKDYKYKKFTLFIDMK